MLCPNCGLDNDNNSENCMRCGSPLYSAPQAAVFVQPEPVFSAQGRKASSGSSKTMRILLVILIVLVLAAAGGIIFLLVYSGNDSGGDTPGKSEKKDRYSAVDSVLTGITGEEGFSSLPISEKKDKMINALIDLENDGKIDKNSIFYDESSGVVWFSYDDGFDGGIMLSEFTDGISGTSDESYVTYWLDSGLPGQTNGTIYFADDNYPFFEEDVAALELKAKYMIGLPEKYSDICQEYKKLWDKQHLTTDIDDNCSVSDFLTGIEGYDLVFIEEHGIIRKDEPLIVTRELFNSERYQDKKDDLCSLIEPDGNKYWLIKPDFFMNNYSKDQLSGAIIWLGMCNSYKYDKLADILMQCGASAVVGYNDSVLTDYDFKLQDAFVYGLMFGKTVSDSLEFSQSVWFKDDRTWFEVSTGSSTDKLAASAVTGAESENVLLINTKPKHDFHDNE